MSYLKFINEIVIPSARREMYKGQFTEWPTRDPPGKIREIKVKLPSGNYDVTLYKERGRKYWKFDTAYKH